MQGRTFSERAGISGKTAIVNVVLVANAFIWYFYAFSILRELIKGLPSFELAAWGVNFAGIAISAILGAAVTERFKLRIPFFLYWMFAGIVISIIPVIVNVTTITGLLIISALFGAYFGLGMPLCMGYYTSSTPVENRSKLGGIMFLLIGLGSFSLGAIPANDIIANSLMLAAWRGVGLLALLLLKPVEKQIENSNEASYTSIISDRSFLLYFIPWCMFSLVNYMTVPVIVKFFGETIASDFSNYQYVIVGVSAVFTGFFADIVGRKRLAVAGFAILGLGYAFIGIFPEGPNWSWIFYVFADGIAWGAFFTLFLMTVWGDLAQSRKSERYYAIGGLPYLFSNFMRLLIGTYIADTIKVSTSANPLFSFASFFLFLAVLPLVYAPETLPEKKIKERELKIYIEKARKAKEKYA